MRTGKALDANPHILIVDDQPDIREALTEHLSKHGFRAHGVESAALARQYLAEQAVDLIVLDIMMPGEDGLSLCRYVADTLDVPVILLTALADDTDRIVGLEIGADDYVTKPFNPRELVARIRSVLRRSRGKATAVGAKALHFGSWTFDLALLELKDGEGVIVPLSTGEQKLLKAFLENPDATLSRDDLFGIMKGRESLPFERSLDNMISRLRKKLEPDPANPVYIKTVWGGGYRFAQQVTPQ